MTDRRQYTRNRQAERQAEGRALLGGRCAHCGSGTELEFDHIDGSTKVANVSTLAMAARAKWLAEVLKCQLLCRGCHEAKSIAEAGKKAAKGAHGTESSYRYCRCDLCRQAKSSAWRAYKPRRALRQAEQPCAR